MSAPRRKHRLRVDPSDRARAIAAGIVYEYIHHHAQTALGRPVSMGPDEDRLIARIAAAIERAAAGGR